MVLELFSVLCIPVAAAPPPMCPASGPYSPPSHFAWGLCLRSRSRCPARLLAPSELLTLSLEITSSGRHSVLTFLGEPSRASQGPLALPFGCPGTCPSPACPLLPSLQSTGRDGVSLAPSVSPTAGGEPGTQQVLNMCSVTNQLKVRPPQRGVPLPPSCPVSSGFSFLQVPTSPSVSRPDMTCVACWQIQISARGHKSIYLAANAL